MIAARDLPHLRWHLVVALAMALAGSLVLWRVHREHATAIELHRAAERRLIAVAERYQRALRDEDDARAALARFEALRASGTVGPERRLDWIEALRQIRGALQLPSLQYEIRPQRPLGSAGAPGPRLMASSMTVDVELLHEGELVALLDALRRQPSAVVVPRGCTVERLSGAQRRGTANLRASCELDWVTVETPAAAHVEGAPR